MKLSVVVAVYQAEKTIARCLDSLLQVEEPSMQIIVVNDGSTDGTEDICRLFEQRDSRVTVLCQENLGRCVARNVGIEASSGEWLMFVDADDEVFPDGVRQMLGMLSTAQFDVLQASYGLEAGAPGTGKTKMASGCDIARFIACNDCGSSELVAWASETQVLFRAVWGKCYRRVLIVGTCFHDGLRFGEDALFNIECLDGARVLLADCVAYRYNVGEGGTCARYSAEDFPSLELLYRNALPLFSSRGYGMRLLLEFVGLDGYYRMQLAAESGVACDALCSAVAACPHVFAGMGALRVARTPLAARNAPALFLLAAGKVKGAYCVTVLLQRVKKLLRRRRR